MVDRLVAVGDNLTLPAAVLVPPGRVVTVKPSGGDDTAAVQAALTAGGTVRLAGAYSLTSTLTIATANTLLDLAPGTNLTTTISAGDAVLVTAANVTIRGGTITSPATWDGTNVEPTYGVIRTTAAGLRVDGVTLVNVPKVGVYADDADDVSVTDCRIIGNYPAGSWSGTQTGHFGVAIDPNHTSSTPGRAIVRGNIIRSCVQGVFLGNYGDAATGSYGTTITGNVFDGCHNHGVYNAGGIDAVTVTGNTFTRCSLPVALTGAGHVVSSNTMFTHATGNNLDLIGISLREPTHCVVTGNTLKGDAPAAAVIIELGNYTSTVMTNNVVANNVIEMTAGTSVGIRIGRLAQTETCHDNVVTGNVIVGTGNAGVGLITIAPKVATVGRGNKVTGNTLVVKGDSHGIYVANVQHVTIQNNTIRFEYNAPSAKVLAGVQLSAVARAMVTGNDFANVTGFGTNVTIRAIWETAGCSNCAYGPSRHDAATGLTAYTSIFTVSGTDCFVDESGAGSPTGAFFAAPGSRWSRTDGGASTSFYVKETASTSATWRAV